MSLWKPPVAALVFASLLAGCHAAPGEVAEKQPPPRPAPADAAYVAPPAVTTVRQAGATMTVAGQAPPRARVRLATPDGVAQYVLADGRGRWSFGLPTATEPRILGLSAQVGGRQVQSQGYLLVTPSGRAALLRAGAGAVRLDPQPAASVGAFDFDGQGGAVVSGAAPAGAVVTLRLDGLQAAEGRADAAGRYSIALPSPITAGGHVLEVSGKGFAARAAVDVRRAAPLAGGPFRSELTPTGVRADWTTPGGGLQSTLILG